MMTKRNVCFVMNLPGPQGTTSSSIQYCGPVSPRTMPYSSLKSKLVHHRGNLCLHQHHFQILWFHMTTPMPDWRITLDISLYQTLHAYITAVNHVQLFCFSSCHFKQQYWNCTSFRFYIQLAGKSLCCQIKREVQSEQSCDLLQQSQNRHAKQRTSKT